MSKRPKTVTIHGREIPVVSLDDLPTALGLPPGDTVEVVTPQFERRESDAKPSCPPDFGALDSLDAGALREMGCRVWCDPWEDDWPHQGKTLLLFPGEWYRFIPDGFVIISIMGKTGTFKRGETDDDIRFGCLSFGVLRRSRTAEGLRREINEFLNRLSIESDCKLHAKFEGWSPGQVIRYIKAAIGDDVMDER